MNLPFDPVHVGSKLQEEKAASFLMSLLHFFCNVKKTNNITYISKMPIEARTENWEISVSVFSQFFLPVSVEENKKANHCYRPAIKMAPRLISD